MKHRVGEEKSFPPTLVFLSETQPPPNKTKINKRKTMLLTCMPQVHM